MFCQLKMIFVTTYLLVFSQSISLSNLWVLFSLLIISIMFLGRISVLSSFLHKHVHGLTLNTNVILILLFFIFVLPCWKCTSLLCVLSSCVDSSRGLITNFPTSVITICYIFSFSTHHDLWPLLFTLMYLLLQFNIRSIPIVNIRMGVLYSCPLEFWEYLALRLNLLSVCQPILHSFLMLGRGLYNNIVKLLNFSVVLTLSDPKLCLLLAINLLKNSAILIISSGKYSHCRSERQKEIDR